MTSPRSLLRRLAILLVILSLLAPCIYVSPTEPATAATIIHNVTSSALVWGGNWAQPTYDPMAIGYYRRYTQNNGDYVQLTFTGTTISYVYMMAYNRGVVEVKLDNKIVDILDARSNDFQQDLITQVHRRQVIKTYATYPGQHTIRLTLRRGDSGSGRYFMDLDALIIDIGYGGYGTYDQSNPYVSYFGSWYRFDADDAYNDWFLFSEDPGAGLRFTFEGDHFIWYYTKANNRGKVAVTIDGGVGRYLVDQWSSTTQRNQYTIFDGLGAGTHTIEIVNLGAHNPNSTGYLIDVDAFNVYYSQYGNAYNRFKAANYADSYTHVYNTYYVSFPDNDCTNFSSQVLHYGGFYNNPSDPSQYDMNDPHQWWYDPILGLWPYYSSITWRATPEFVDEYVPFRSAEFQFKSRVDYLKKGDLIVLDHWDLRIDDFGHDGLPDHVRIVLDWNYSSPFNVDYIGDGDNYVTNPIIQLLIDQHTTDRWHVPFNYALRSGDIYKYVHVIKN